jgi:V/A-type H+-transporting ATPase subunit K
MLLFISLPLLLIYRRVKRGSTSVKKPLYANLGLFFAVLAVSAVVFLKQGVSAASDAAAAENQIATAGGYIAAALAVGISGLGGGKAVASTASAAIGALAENESTFGKALVFVGMAEGIALYGMLVAFIILSSL